MLRSQTIADPRGAQPTGQSRGSSYENVLNSGVDPHWFYCGSESKSGSSFPAQCGSGSRGQTNADPDSDPDQKSQKVKFLHEKYTILKVPVVPYVL